MVLLDLNHSCEQSPGYRHDRAIGRPQPVVISSPHSGCHYPDALLDQSRLDRHRLQSLDDGPVDRLMDGALAAGADLVSAVFPRAVIDLNRSPNELDPRLIDDPSGLHLLSSIKSRVGLGVVPSRVMGQPIYKRQIKRADFEDRLQQAYWPYYQALEHIIADRLGKFDRVLLLDCHSMPDKIAHIDQNPVDITFGDRLGTSSDPDLIETAMKTAREAGFSVSYNHPFAGGRITEHFGRPAASISAMQIEFRRGLFMDQRDQALQAGMACLAQFMALLVVELSRVLDHDRASQAA